MNVGFFTKQEDGAIFGSLPTLRLNGVSIEPVRKQGNGPDFIATVEGAELGAAWNKTAGPGGRAYLSLKIVIPGQEPLFMAIFQQPTEGEYVAVWSEPKPKEA